jgi:hypothetical protein
MGSTQGVLALTRTGARRSRSRGGHGRVRGARSLARSPGSGDEPMGPSP